MLSDLGPVHDPALNRIVDGVKKSGDHEKRGAQNSAPFADAGVVRQVQHEQTRHDAGAERVGGAEQDRTQVILESKFIGIFHLVFHDFLSFVISEKAFQLTIGFYKRRRNKYINDV